MSDGLAALKIDRSRRRRAIVWPWLLALAVLAGALAAPQVLGRLRVVEVSVAAAEKSGAAAGNANSAPELSAAGYVVADRQSTLAFRGTGRLLKMNVAESQRVKKDEIVAEVDHRELDAGIEQVKAEQGEAAAEVERLRKLAAQAEAESHAAQAPLQTLDKEMEQYEIARADADRRLKRDDKLVKGNAMPASEVDDRLTEVRMAEAKKAWTKERKAEAQARITVAEAQAAVARAAVEVARAREISAAARLKVLESQLYEAFIRAPFDGVVTEKMAEVGEIVAPISIGGSMARGSIVTIADWNSLQAEVDVAETQIGKIKPGQRAAITVDAFPDKTFPGKVRRILPRANRSKATVQARVDFLERDDTVLPEMGVRVKFLSDDAPPGAESGAARDKILVPKSALKSEAGAAFVWVVTDGIASKRPVVAGEPAGEKIEIKTGLTPGEKVVLRGGESLREDKQPVKVVE